MACLQLTPTANINIQVITKKKKKKRKKLCDVHRYGVKSIACLWRGSFQQACIWHGNLATANIEFN
jgi:hypothetical protein